MWRNLHALFGLSALALALVLSVSGAILATAPTVASLGPDAQRLAGISVADAIEALLQANSGLEIDRLKVSPAGAVTVQGRLDGRSLKQHADIRTGALLSSEGESALYVFMRDLHRTFLLGEAGRPLAFAAALAMTAICLSGGFLLVRRMGGWRRLFSPVRGKWSEKLHVLSGRLVLVPLTVTVVSGLYLSATTMGIIPSGAETPPAYPESLEARDPVPPHSLRGLIDTPLDAVREVSFPIPEDWFDVFTITTPTGYRFFDQFTGALLAEQPFTPAQQFYNLFALLHTAEGAAPWGIVAGIAVLAVPIFAVTGLIIWFRRLRSGAGRIRAQAAGRDAAVIVAVGSENNTTWGFAGTLHAALVGAGQPTRTLAINDLRGSYPSAKLLLVLTATFGDGDAPKNAGRFAERLKALRPGDLPKFAVLGFGDRAFPAYCAFARQVDHTLAQTGRQPLLDLADIDRKSAQGFAAWGRRLGAALGLELPLDYAPPRPKTRALVLSERDYYGADLQRPTVRLRFNGRIPSHEAGDLLAVVPPGATAPRYYSLASSRAERCVEICVAREDGGLCSCHLAALALGETIDAYVEPNPHFKPPARGRRPLVMIGAGTGIAPFAGMIRRNIRARPIDLFWGNRHPKSDYLYEHDIAAWLESGKLANFHAAFSRGERPAYVQDLVRAQARHVAERLKAGATVMICGSRAMADGVGAALDEIAGPLGLGVTELKRRGRYLEDIY